MRTLDWPAGAPASSPVNREIPASWVFPEGWC
jgi:hypothetical protein